MAETIIAVENLSKSYLVGHRTGRGKRYTALRDVLVREATQFYPQGNRCISRAADRSG